jgi:lysophospholipase L1-like esterase
MKKYLIASLFLLLLSAAYAKVPAKKVIIEASDARITWIGRTLVDEGSVSFDWTGTYGKVRFIGNTLSFRVSDTKKNYYNVWLDGTMDSAPDKVLAVHGNDTTIVIFSEDEIRARYRKDRDAVFGPHQVILQKRTEGEQGKTTVHCFTTNGEFLQAEAPKDRIIEFIGDSYTCGYGTEASCTDHFSPETENQNLTYACESARYFGADQIVIAHSGMGISRNFNGNLTGDHMPERYLQTFDSEKDAEWDASASTLKPAITVIYLGTNDFSRNMQPSKRQFTRNYITLLKEIKGFYGADHPVLCIAPKHDALIHDYIRGAIETSGLENVHFAGLSPSLHNDKEDMGADGHPNYSGHTKLAYNVIPYISTITGWEMSGNEVK